MDKPDFKEKFIAFVDILGFKLMIEEAEQGRGRNLTEIRALLRELARTKDKGFYAEYGPQVCPQSSFVQKDLDFEITQVSDCAIVSSEISPAGAINLVNHCWSAAMMLLSRGVMVRGYITRGRIYHQGSEFYGTGYHEAYKREAGVTAFKMEADEKGTPFVEIDPTVSDFIHHNTDDCVRKMFDRYVKQDDDVVALFPFARLSHSFVIGGFATLPFDAERERQANNNMRNGLIDLKVRIMEHVDRANEGAMRKARHYIAALDHQLGVCDQTDDMIDRLGRPFPRPL